MSSLVPVTAGPIQALFQPSDGMLRRIRLGDHEICRGIYGAVRDANWDTLIPVLEALSVSQSTNSFEITFVAQCQDFHWRGEITGKADGTITYTFDGEAEAEFRRNRIGLCVLHPIKECAGLSCRVDHVHGKVTGGFFPEFISPHQPFFDLRAISHLLEDGKVTARIEMTGDTFEMEDQRNWTDASFKTYSTPLSLPFPVAVAKGECVAQSVCVSLKGGVESRSGDDGSPIRVGVDWERTRPWIPLGLQASPSGSRLTNRELDFLQALRLDHLRVDIALDTDSWAEDLKKGMEECHALGCEAMVALMLSESSWSHLKEVKDLLAPAAKVVLVFHRDEKVTTESHLGRAEEVLGRPVVGGTNAYFAELNRERPPVESQRTHAFSINPQVHAFDDLSLMETLEAQPVTLSSAQHFCQGEFIVGPITLLPRFNPNATEDPHALLPQNDARQHSDFAAAWTLGSLVALQSSDRLGRLTYHQTIGGAGLLGQEGPYPLYRLFRMLAGASRLAQVANAHTSKVAVLAPLYDDQSRSIIVGNLTNESQHVVLEDQELVLDSYEFRQIEGLCS